MDYLALGKRIKDKRISLNMTQEKLAELADISAVYVGQIERGDRHMTLDVLVKMANLLNSSVEELLKDSVPTTNSRMKELNNLVQNLKEEEIEQIIRIIKALYYLKIERKNVKKELHIKREYDKITISIDKIKVD